MFEATRFWNDRRRNVMMAMHWISMDAPVIVFRSRVFAAMVFFRYFLESSVILLLLPRMILSIAMLNVVGFLFFVEMGFLMRVKSAMTERAITMYRMLIVGRIVPLPVVEIAFLMLGKSVIPPPSCSVL